MPVEHKPAAAWSRDSLAAWQWMLDNTEPLKHVGTDPKHIQIEFLRRWAAKILCLVNDEMPWSDWYWFLDNHFNRELKKADPYHKSWETDPKGEEREKCGPTHSKT